MRNRLLQRGSWKYGIVVGVAAGFFAVTVTAFAEGLSDEDYLYLATIQHVDHSATVLHISPMERETLHYLINDPQASTDPAMRDKKVKNALDEFLAHQLWERSHPGQLWDAAKRP
jgi:hypothetical protein